MGLDDIDDDVPVTTKMRGTSTTKNDLDDIFGDIGIVTRPKGGSAPVAQPTPPPAPVAAPKVDILDSLFSAAPPPQKSGVPEVDDLFDFSKPSGPRKVHSDQASLLQAFESNAKGVRSKEQPTLGEVNRGPSTSRVAAQLLSLMNYYDVLGVSQQATEEEIKRQYKKKALELHPDKVGQNQTAEEAALFKTITKAHEVLMNPESRRLYDQKLKAEECNPDADWLQHLKRDA